MKKQGFTLITLLTLVVIFLVLFQALVRAQGGADYGRGPETDPVATLLANTVSGRVTTLQGQFTSVSGQVQTIQGQFTSVSGQVAVASANAADWTNHAAGMVASYTNILITADGKTNTVVVQRGSIKSWSVTQ